jgi:hypothetical protein
MSSNRDRLPLSFQVNYLVFIDDVNLRAIAGVRSKLKSKFQTQSRFVELAQLVGLASPDSNRDGAFSKPS